MAIGLVLAGSIGTASPQTISVSLDSAAAADAVEIDAVVLEDWEFTRANRGSRCRFTRPDVGPAGAPPPFFVPPGPFTIPTR